MDLMCRDSFEVVQVRKIKEGQNEEKKGVKFRGSGRASQLLQ